MRDRQPQRLRPADLPRLAPGRRRRARRRRARSRRSGHRLRRRAGRPAVAVGRAAPARCRTSRPGRCRATASGRAPSATATTGSRRWRSRRGRRTRSTWRRRSLFRSLDGGESWKEISPDLTGADPRQDCGGDVPVERATACGYGVDLRRSRRRRRPTGWSGSGRTTGACSSRATTGAQLDRRHAAGLADWSKIASIDPSPTDPATAYVAVDRHRLDDFAPAVWQTHDFGATWREIGGGLPAGAGWASCGRTRASGTLYAGTSRGVSVSFDDGEHWQSLQLDLPTTGINDLRVHGDDVIATQGRGIWALDNVAPLRQLPDAALAPRCSCRRRPRCACAPTRTATRRSPRTSRAPRTRPSAR